MEGLSPMILDMGLKRVFFLLGCGSGVLGFCFRAVGHWVLGIWVWAGGLLGFGFLCLGCGVIGFWVSDFGLWGYWVLNF